MLSAISLTVLGILSAGLTCALLSARATAARWKSDAQYWERQHREQAHFIREIKIGLFKEKEFARLQADCQRALARAFAAESEAAKWRNEAAMWRDEFKQARVKAKNERLIELLTPNE